MVLETLSNSLKHGLLTNVFIISHPLPIQYKKLTKDKERLPKEKKM
jgi:hypothetical protein